MIVVQETTLQPYKYARTVREQPRRGLLRPLLGCSLPLPAYLYGWSVVSWTTIIGAYAFKREWKKGPSKSEKPIWLRLGVLAICGALYLSMWGSYLYFNAEIVNNGDKIKLRDAL